jgi:TP901 family phage tail tape measure protein
MAADLEALDRRGQTFGQRFRTAAQGIGAVGRQMQLIGGIGTFALGLAANQAAQLQTKVTLAATQITSSVAGTRARAEKDFQGILSQMTKFPQSADDMSAALYDVYSTLNVTGKQGIPILQQINKAAVAGGLSTQDAASGLLSVISNFDKGRATVRNVREDYNRMFAAVRYGRVTMEELSTALGTTAPAAKIAGQSLGNMAGTFAFLSRSLGPQKAAVSYARLVEALGSNQMQEGLKKVGVNIDGANGKMLGLDKVMQILIKRFPYLAQGGVKALNFFKDIGNIQSTIQARRAFATLATNMAGYRDVLHKTMGDNNEFSKSYKAMASTLGVQWGVFLNTLKSIVVTVGMTVIPAFLEMAKPLREAVTWFQNLSPATKEMIGRFAAFAAVGALVLGTFAAITGGILAIIGSLSQMGAAIAILGTGVGSMTFLAVIAKKIYDNWDTLGPLFKKVANDLRSIFTSLGEAVKAFYEGDWNAVWSHLGDAIKAAIPGVKDALDLLTQSIIAWGKDFVTTTQGVITAALSGMFLMARRRGAGGAVGERLLGGLSSADLMAPLVGVAGGPMGMAITAAAKSDDLEKLAKYVPFMSTQQKMAYEELQTRQKIANTWRNQVNAQADAYTVRKQISALEELDRRGLTASSVVRSGETLVSRTPKGGFASAAERASALEIMNRAPAAAGAAEKAMAALNVTTMAIAGSAANAGKGMLSFIGFGNPWIGGAIAGAAAIYGLKTALDSVFTTTATKVNEEYKSVGAMKASAEAANQAARNYITYSNQVKTLNKAIADTKARLGKDKGGTLAYQSDLKTLAQLQDQLKTATENATRAAQDQASTFNTALQNVNPKNINDSLATLRQVAQGAPIGTATYGNFQNLNLSGTGKTAVDTETYNKARATVNGLTSAFATNVDTILAVVASGQKLTKTQRDMITQMGHVASTYKSDLPGLSTLMQDLTQATMDSVKALGRVPGNMAGFAQYANSIPQAIKPAADLFMRITHQAPNIPFLQMLDNLEKKVPGASKVMAAFVATQGKLPKQKQYNFLFHRPAWAESWMARFIQLHHRIPTHKEVNIEIKAHDEASKKIREVQRRVGQLQRAGHQVMRLGTGQNPLASQIEQASRQLTRVKAPKLHGIVRYTIQGNAFKAFPRQASTAASNASKNLDVLTHHAGVVGTQSGTAWGSNFSATAKGTAHATVSVIINAYKKTLRITSPSKVMKKQIGDPMLQGILAGLKDKASIKDGAQTAVSTMMDVFSQFKDTFKTQMGDLFAGPTFVPVWKQAFGSELQQTLEWGGRVSFRQLQSDLQSQVRTFQRYQHMLARLRRRGASASLIAELRQLGPEATPEVEGLLGATRRQLRAYSRLYGRSQRDINKAATRATKDTYKQWRKQGAAVALGFLQGMQDHSARLARYFARIFQGLINQVKHKHKSHSPSRLYMEEGMNVMRGFQIGVMRQHSKMNLEHYFGAPVRGRMRGMPQVASVTNNYYYNRTYNVYPQKDESLLSALRKHDHVTRHRP